MHAYARHTRKDPQGKSFPNQYASGRFRETGRLSGRDVLSTFTEKLTGGVHNAYPDNDYAYELSNGDKYVILDMADIYAPRIVDVVGFYRSSVIFG